MIRTARLALLLPLVTACASGAHLPNARTDRSVVTVQTTPGGAGQQLALTHEVNTNSVDLQAEVAEAWAGLPRVFEALEIPLSAADNSTRSLSTTQRLGRIGGKRISSFFRCPGPYGKLASSGDVYVSVRAQILPGEGGTGSVLRTQITATARASTGGSQVQCSGNGSLQKLITDTLVQRLANL